MSNRMIGSPHVFVISHERSGTHVAIDALRNNFPIYKSQFYTSLDRMTDGRQFHRHPEIIEARLQIAPSVIKTHMFLDTNAFFDNGGPISQLVTSLVQNAKLIYVYRDGRDVLGSLYTFWTRTIPKFNGITFSDMLRGNYTADVGKARRGSSNPVSYWRNHAESWIGREDVLALSFEEFVNNYDETILRIGKFLEREPIEPLKSVLRNGSGVKRGRLRETLLTLYMRKIKGIELTSVSFNKGASGGHRAAYSEEDLAFFDQQAGELLDHLGYPKSSHYR